MTTRMVLVKEDDAAVISCPGCGKTKKLSVELFKQKNQRDLRVKCSCASVFNLCLEFRKEVRRPVKLLGKCINLSKQRESQNIIIKNISMGGLGFTPFEKHKTMKDDLLFLSFELNDYNNTLIDTHAVVRMVIHDFIGCEFNNPQPTRKPLGFYLLG